MTPLLTPGVRDKLDAVLVPNPSTGRTRLAWLQREATAITPSAILAEIGKLTVLGASAHLEPRAVGVTAFAEGLMPADGVACGIGVAQRMYDREVLFDRN